MKLFVKNINFQTTSEELSLMFGIFGEVNRVDIPLDKKIKLPKGFAFVHFEKENDAKEAMNQLQGRLFGGRELDISRAKK
jgi:RNA recognition motif-containing protein